MSNPSITLEVLDLKSAEDKFIRPISTYFSNPSTQVLVEEFCKFLSNSAKYNSKEEILSKFANYKSQVVIQCNQHSLDPNGLIGNLEKLINIGSKNFTKFNDIRGKLFEALLVGLHGGVRNMSKTFGWGVGLKVPSPQSAFIEYIDPEYEGFKNNKKTFDVAYLSQQNNHLYECKIAPEGLGNLEIGYFKEVASCFAKHKLPYEIYLFSSVKTAALKFRLLQKRSLLQEITIQEVGYDDIHKVISQYK